MCSRAGMVWLVRRLCRAAELVKKTGEEGNPLTETNAAERRGKGSRFMQVQVKTGRRWLAVGFILLILCCTVGLALAVTAASNTKISSSQEDYPVLPQGPASSGIMDFNLGMMSYLSDSIVVAQVQELLPQRDSNRADNSSSLDFLFQNKLGGKQKPQEYPVKLKIQKNIKGEAQRGETITLARTGSLDYQPQLRDGDRMILFLQRDQDGEYTILAPQHGYFYVAQDEKVYPALPASDLQETSGMKVNAFAREVKTRGRSFAMGYVGYRVLMDA